MRKATFEPTAMSAPGKISTDNADGFATFRLALSLPISAGVGGSFTSTGGKLIMLKLGEPDCGALATGACGLVATGLGAAGGGAAGGATTGVGAGAGADCGTVGNSGATFGVVAVGAGGTKGGSDDGDGAAAGACGMRGGCEFICGAAEG